jgi:uncharacterized protein (DUF2384 family)
MSAYSLVSNSTPPATGAVLYDPVLLDRDEFNARERRTHLTPAEISNPSLRDALFAFDDALCYQPDHAASKLISYRKRAVQSSLQEPSRGQPHAVFPVGAIDEQGIPALQVWLRPDRIVTMTVVNNSAQPLFDVVVSPTSASGVFLSPTGPVIAYAHRYPDSVVFNDSQPLAVNAVNQIATWLGVKSEIVLKAAGIKKRTYHEWKRRKVKNPRPMSEGRLWELHQVASDLVETRGEIGIRRWLHGDSRRLRMLTTVSLDDLMAEAYAPKTDARPAWVEAGSPERSPVMPRIVPKLEPMDPHDVVEPE